MRRTKILEFAGAAAAITLLVVMSSPAGEMKPPTPEEQEQYQQKLFDLLDADNDGKVTEKEFAVAVLWDEFQKYDKDGDGKVSKAEYDKMPKKEDIWSELDPTGKGYVSFEDCVKNKIVVEDLHKEWQSLLGKLNKRPGSRYITKADLPDLTP